MYNLFSDMELDTKLINEAYAEANGLLSDLCIEEAELIHDYMDEIFSEMAKNNIFETCRFSLCFPSRKAIRNIFKATETIIKVVYPDAEVTYNEYRHKTKEGNIVEFEIDVDKETYKKAVKRMAEKYEINEEDELRRLGVTE